MCISNCSVECSSPNCAECPWRWSCKRCDPGFALYKRTLWSECLKTCPRLYRPVLDAEKKTLVCKYKPGKCLLFNLTIGAATCFRQSVSNSNDSNKSDYR